MGSTSEREEFGVTAPQVKMSLQVTCVASPSSTFFIGAMLLFFLSSLLRVLEFGAHCGSTLKFRTTECERCKAEALTDRSLLRRDPR